MKGALGSSLWSGPSARDIPTDCVSVLMINTIEQQMVGIQFPVPDPPFSRGKRGCKKEGAVRATSKLHPCSQRCSKRLAVAPFAKSSPRTNLPRALLPVCGPLHAPQFSDACGGNARTLVVKTPRDVNLNALGLGPSSQTALTQNPPLLLGQPSSGLWRPRNLLTSRIGIGLHLLRGAAARPPSRTPHPDVAEDAWRAWHPLRSCRGKAGMSHGRRAITLAVQFRSTLPYIEAASKRLAGARSRRPQR
ncbi:uncharacterized protein VTP21DRAFT_9414 [Calcarisporiella thermophila]|uniref:uncharacterized protein n=1 Tax=Calcarisporiella thermophila TaxID=911321 RepID=UPI003744A3BE